MEKKIKTREFVWGSVLVGIIVLMAFTPLGYLRTGGLDITFLMIPVVIGAVTLGPLWGALLGFVFGLTSFINAFSNAFGTTLLSISLPATVFNLFVPRILMGLCTGLIYKALSALIKEKPLFSMAAAGLAGPLLNTLFFMSSLILLFGKTDFIQSLMAGKAVLPFVVAFVGVNGLVEAVASFIVSTAICRALVRNKK